MVLQADGGKWGAFEVNKLRKTGMEARNVWLLCEGIECSSLYLEGEDPLILLGFVL